MTPTWAFLGLLAVGYGWLAISAARFAIGMDNDRTRRGEPPGGFWMLVGMFGGAFLSFGGTATILLLYYAGWVAPLVGPLLLIAIFAGWIPRSFRTVTWIVIAVLWSGWLMRRYAVSRAEQGSDRY